jgi:hypothetical protein
VAAFIAEPVQGAGGVIVPPANYWPLVREVCDRHGVLLIADEVVTGFGRTGAMFGTRLWGVKADLWCLAKGISSGYMPLGATAIGRQVPMSSTPTPPAWRQVTHGYTYSAHPVAAAAALATLDILLERRTSPATRRSVGAIPAAPARPSSSVSRFVGDVRGHGPDAACIEMVADKAKRTPLPAAATCPPRGPRRLPPRRLMVRMSGPNLILSPPLVITRNELDYLCRHAGSRLCEVEATLTGLSAMADPADRHRRHQERRAAFLREHAGPGRPALVMDVGVLAAGATFRWTSPTGRGRCRGTTLQPSWTAGDENTAMTLMATGAALLAARLHAEGRIHGLLALGGTMGTDLALDVAPRCRWACPRWCCRPSPIRT